MPWQPLPRIAFAVATYPFPASSPADLPLEIGDELYVIEETPDGKWLRGYLVAPPSLLAGLTSVKGQTLEARVFSGIFPRSCVEVREMLGEIDEADIEDDNEDEDEGDRVNGREPQSATDSAKAGIVNGLDKGGKKEHQTPSSTRERRPLQELPNGTHGNLSVPVKRDPNAPRPPAPVPMLKVGDETPTSASEPLIDEIASCLREWHSTNLHGLLLGRQYERLDQLSELISGLYLHRQQLLYNVLTAHEYGQLREKTVWDLVTVNKLCGGEVIVRDPAAHGRILTGDDSAVEVATLQSTMSLLDEPPQPIVDPVTSHHLLLDVKGFAGSSSEDTLLVFSLASKAAQGKLLPVSESFTVAITSGGTLGSLADEGQTRTLFTDLSSQDIGDGSSADSELYLVVRVVASQQISSNKPPSRTGTGPPTAYSKDPAKTPTAGGSKSSRRSFMWGNMPSRSAFSRGATSSAKMDSVSEQKEERPSTETGESRDGQGPPSSSSSRKGALPADVQTAQRTIGVGILKLNTMVKHEDEAEQVMAIWSRSFGSNADQGLGDDWNPIIREIMDNPMGQYEKSTRGERLQVFLKSFSHPDAAALIKSTPTILSGVSRTGRMGFSTAPTRSRSDIYFTINHAALAKQNLLSRYGGSATAMPASGHGQNFQLTLEVRRSSGQRIESCIYTSSNAEPLTTFKSVAVERSEAWAQTIRLSLAPDDVPTAHVVMFLADMPSPPFAVAHVPLWDQQAFIRDGPHGLLLYRIDEYTSTAQAGPVGKGGYLSVPWSPRGRDERSAEVTGPLAILTVETFLCSTKFSQDRAILGLIKWKESPRDAIPGILRQLNFVAEIEVVKLLSDVLDGLFGILVEYSGNDEYEDLVFSALVRVLGIVHDRRFNLGPLVDLYAENKFNYPFATPCLVRSFTRLLENPTEPETARKLRATFKVVRHILKFITHARGQQRAKEAGIGITSSVQGFTRNLRSIFKALDAMMRNSAPVLVGSQTLAVQHFHTWLPELSGLLKTEEIVHIAIDFMDSCANVKGKLVLYKLILIIHYSKLDLFQHAEQKSALSANTVRWIAPHWGHAEVINDQWREQIRLCCSVVASQVDHLSHEIPDHIPKIVDSYLAILAVSQKPRQRLSLLFPSSYPFPTKQIAGQYIHDEALAELSAVLSAISNSPAGMQLELAETDLTSMLENLIQVHLSILNGEAFPADWLSLQIYHHKSTMNVLQHIAGIMLESFVPEPDDAEDFNMDLWKLFFTALLRLVSSPSLALETFPEQKRRAVWKIAGDVREHGAELLRTTWEAIGWEASAEERTHFGLAKMGGYQVQYVPALVGPIVELCLSVHEGLRKMAVEVLQTMIVSEWTLGEDLSAIQTEMIDCLDNFFKSKPVTESIVQKLFIGELLERFDGLSEASDEPLHVALRELVGTLDEFLELLTALHCGEATTEASNLINQLRLMEFLREMQKEEIFVRYVHQLAKFLAESGHHAEAGLALRLHADLYEWDPTSLTGALPEPDFPAQTAFERKERVYFDMIKHFEDAESWSNALTAYKELETQYETNIFDFAKLARTQRSIATVYETISKTDRITPKYFKVVFKGSGFPSSMRDKEFIYEGTLNERGSAFTDRMQEQYPNAKVVTSGDIDEVEGQYLVMSNVTPHRDLSHSVFQRTRVPQVIRDFLLASHPQTFSVITKRVTSGPVEEHFSEKLIYTTAEPFPTILRRSEIIDAALVKLDAHTTALERIVRKTQEMTLLERRVAEGDEDSAPLLLDAVSVSVNPISDNSVICYRQLLPRSRVEEANGSDDNSRNEDEENDDIDADEEDEGEEVEEELEPRDSAIKMALVDHAMIIKKCLALFSRSTNDAVVRRREELQRCKSISMHPYNDDMDINTHAFLDYDLTFEPEIAIFSPPQPVQETSSPVSPVATSRRKSSQVQDQSVQATSIATVVNGARVEEASVVRPVSVQQRNTRLSFLDKRKYSDAQRDAGYINGDMGEPASPISPLTGTMSRDGNYRTSMLRHQSSDIGRNQSTDHFGFGEDGTDLSKSRSQTEHASDGGSLTKKGSVRKRLSMLKLGVMKNKGGTMGSLDEE